VLVLATDLLLADDPKHGFGGQPQIRHSARTELEHDRDRTLVGYAVVQDGNGKARLLVGARIRVPLEDT
jgi:hypothetical protein